MSRDTFHFFSFYFVQIKTALKISEKFNKEKLKHPLQEAVVMIWNALLDDFKKNFYYGSLQRQYGGMFDMKSLFEKRLAAITWNIPTSDFEKTTKQRVSAAVKIVRTFCLCVSLTTCRCKMNCFTLSLRENRLKLIFSIHEIFGHCWQA